ncbi:MAG: DEAD/DEAH box helicase family protein [Anaerolineae bacterium]|nr:DEAD/DEAH box helicase family protein [Anaerolineae bacterium]
MPDPTELVIQPPPNPILCSPYEEPSAYWFYDRGTGIPQKLGGRRPASYFYKTERSSGTGQLSFLAEEERDDLPLVNALRDDVRQWRKSEYENASQVSKTLLRHWWRADRPRRLFFCQLEAVETIIYLREILAQGKTRRGKASLTQEEFQALARAENPRPEAWNPRVAQYPKLADLPAEPDLKPLMRYACKMATGSGKTVVMAMLIAWALCNRGRVPGDTRYPRHVLAVCPNLTIKERLQVLRPDMAGNYYDAFDLVPSSLRPELNKGKVLVTNWHAFNPESENSEGGKSYRVVNKGAESAEAFARLRLGDLYDGEPIMVLNDEGHHAYRPRPLDESEVNGEVEADREEATIWVSGLDKINSACGISVCVDLSATPFYIGGSGYVEGSPFPWIVSDFALVDAIESGITKIPRLPTSDTTGRIDPKFFKLWENITRDLKPGERQNGGKPKPEVIYRKAQDALLTLASQWKERLELIEAAAPGQERTPPVMILVCDNTQIADYFHKRISGEEEVKAEAIVETEDAEDDDATPKRKKKEKTLERLWHWRCVSGAAVEHRATSGHPADRQHTPGRG